MKNTETVPASDPELILQFRNGNKEAGGKIYLKYFKTVYYKCISFVKDPNEADDLTQDILIKALERLESYRHEALFSTWLYAITLNHCIEYSRRKKHFSTVELFKASSIAIQDEPNENCCTENLLDYTMQHLSAREKEILCLKYLNNLSIKDLQGRYQLSASAVKMRLKRAREKAEKLSTDYYNTN